MERKRKKTLEQTVNLVLNSGMYTKLNNKSSNSRNIWTVGLSTTGLNNFVTSNRSELKGLIFPNTPTATMTIRTILLILSGV